MSQESLIEKLQRKFQVRKLALHGECLEIPMSFFGKDWEEQLEAEGHRVIVGQEGGQIAFYVKLQKGKPSHNVKAELTQDPIALKYGIRRVQYGPSVIVRLPASFVEKWSCRQGDYVFVQQESEDSVRFIPIQLIQLSKKTE